MSAPEISGYTYDAAAGMLIPVWSTEAGKGGNYISTGSIRHTCSILVAFFGGSQNVELIAQPLNSGSGDENTAFKSILNFPGQTDSYGCDKVIFAEFLLIMINFFLDN